jgi:hypothetical protein
MKNTVSSGRRQTQLFADCRIVCSTQAEPNHCLGPGIKLAQALFQGDRPLFVDQPGIGLFVEMIRQVLDVILQGIRAFSSTPIHQKVACDTEQPSPEICPVKSIGEFQPNSAPDLLMDII